jgi:hypothetical protein
MKEIGKIIKEKVMGNIFIVMEIFMKEIGKTIKEKVTRNVSYPNNYISFHNCLIIFFSNLFE